MNTFDDLRCRKILRPSVSRLAIVCLTGLGILFLLSGPVLGEHSVSEENDLKTKPTESDEGTLNESNIDRISVILNATGYKIIKDEDSLDIIEMEGFSSTLSPGDPMLPHKVYDILVPPDAIGSSLQLNIVSAETRVLDGTYDIKPAGPFVPGVEEYEEFWGDGKNIVSGKNINVYETDADFPEKYAELLPCSQMRKWKFAKVDFVPFQYNPVSKKLTLIENAVIEISYNLSPIELDESLMADTVMDDIAPLIFINYDQARGWYEQKIETKPLTTYDYVIITTNLIEANSTKLSSFITHKQNLGYKVLVVTEDEFGTLTGQAPNHRAEKIRQWLINNYASMGIKYVLLIGNPGPYDSGEGDIPMKMCWSYIGDPYGLEESPTDYFYADLTGNWDKDGDQLYGEWGDDYPVAGGVDLAPEVYVGRIPIYGAGYTILDNILQKTIDYETASDIGWRKSILMPMGFLSPNGPYDGAQLGEQMKDDYLDFEGYDSWRMYQQGNGACGLDSIYPSEEELRGGTVVRDRWAADDYGIVCWWGLGGPTHTSVGYEGCSDGLLFWSGYCSRLDDGHPAFTYQCSYSNGRPENCDNLGYAILKQGGIGTVAATRVSWFSTSQSYGEFDGSSTNAGLGYEYVKRLVQGLPAGDALYQTKMGVSPSSAAWLMNWYDFNLYGDPEVSLDDQQQQQPTGWTCLGGHIISPPSMIVDNQGRTHIFAIGGDNALWDNVDGTWYGLGGHLTSAPFAVKDGQGRIHVLIRGGDGGVWDLVFDTEAWSFGWYGLGGYIISMPSAVIEPERPDYLAVMVRGGDDALWMCNLDTLNMTGDWIPLGGSIASAPYAVSDGQGNIHTFAIDGNALWDNVFDMQTWSFGWYGLGGYITSVPSAVIEPGRPDSLAVMVRGGDNTLWMCDLNTSTMTGDWVSLGGVLGSDPYVIYDTQGNIHTFVQGGDSSLWENIFSSSPWNPSGGQWHGHGNCILFNPVAFANGYTHVAVLGCDSALWKNVFETLAPTGTSAEIIPIERDSVAAVMPEQSISYSGSGGTAYMIG